MTAVTTSSRSGPRAAISDLGRLPGVDGLVRKELREWRRGRRAWIVLLVSTVFMVLAALNSWLQANLPAEAGVVPADAIVDPLMNLVGSVSGQIFVVAAIFAVMSLVVGERESGTLAWTASKPVSRRAIWLSKFGVSVVVLWIAAGLIPLAATAALVVVLYGAVPVLPVLAIGIGMGLAIALYIAVALAVSTVVPSQAAVAGIALAAMFLPQVLGIVMPAEFLPTSILQWSILTGVGESAGIVTPIAWAIAVGALVAFALYRMERLEF